MVSREAALCTDRFVRTHRTNVVLIRAVIRTAVRTGHGAVHRFADDTGMDA